ncbi:hypothetical protein [Amycolatopsis tucumanensis]|uniref:Uncharacterized protein n=1 Tax=Amycolatopsis tucumanensis TaxID=401106 RepID=A0ABP7HMY2_9PSEU|nr:hypothetical protein [Amycolatopsis tucumanensis]MCF6421239.1 hypothetical protein [Amycolatopsis tucumanensis]
MAQRWYSEDAGGPVADLDPVFRDGYAPALHGMLKALSVVDPQGPPWGPVWAHTEDLLDQSTELRSTDNNLGPSFNYRVAPGVTLYPIMQGSVHGDGSRDLSVEEFFSHAEILSGQDVGKVKGNAGRDPAALALQDGGWIERAGSALENTRASGRSLSEYGRLETLQVGNGWWAAHWSGPPGSVPHEAQARCSTINEWYDHFRASALTVLAESLTRFGAIVHGARFNLNSLMGACVEQLEKFDAQGEVSPGLSTGWKTYRGIVDLATAGPMAPFTITDKMIEVLQANGTENLDGGGFYGTLYSFLQKADALMHRTVDEVDTLIREMNAKFVIADADLHAPSWTGPAPGIA